MEFSTGGDSRVRLILLENFRNRSPGLRALVIWEETPYLFPAGCPMDSLIQLTRHYRFVVALVYHLILLLSSTGGSALPGCPLCISISCQACVDTTLPWVHPPGDLGLDISGPMDTQRLCGDNVGKDEGTIRVLGPPEYLPSLRSQYGRELAPYCTIGRGVPAIRRQRCYYIALSVTPPSRCNRSL